MNSLSTANFLSSLRRSGRCKFALLEALIFAVARVMAEAPAFFGSGKTLWHGFDRYDFVIDENTPAITPFKSPPS